MTKGKGQPSPGQGFSKRPNLMQVSTTEVVAMQQGYEARIARQKAALDRMTDALQQRTEDVAEQMRRADAMARYRDEAESLMADTNGEEYRIIDRPEIPGIETLFVLIPEDYDLYNEDDTKITILTGYIRFLQSTVRGLNEKITAMTKELEDTKRVARQAQVDAQNNARAANTAQAARVDIGDQDPPWAESQAPFVAQANHTAESVWSDEPDAGNHEVLEWPGAPGTTMPGEQRPGSF